MSTQRANLLDAAQNFCNAFASQQSLDVILDYFALDNAVCVEHGLEQLAPFLGHPYTGPDGVTQYFTTIANLLSYENMHFSEYIVDVETLKVSVKGQARFTFKSTGDSWDEVFTYSLAFDKQLKVKVYEVWADTGAAYLASKGQLSVSPARIF